MQQFIGFPPLFDNNSKILILGSFPGVKSRQQQFYYGNQQNRFWKTLCKAFGGSAQTLAARKNPNQPARCLFANGCVNCARLSIEDKKLLCFQNGIALWDIVVACDIRGSMDSDIKNYVLADLSTVLDKCCIQKILCNGAKAYQLTQRAYHGQIPVVKMPSTSPANVSFDESVWLKELSC